MFTGSAARVIYIYIYLFIYLFIYYIYILIYLSIIVITIIIIIIIHIHIYTYRERGFCVFLSCYDLDWRKVQLCFLFGGQGSLASLLSACLEPPWWRPFELGFRV